ncbi:MAG: valine--tRNA ligase [Planctomycetes bacterium]|nr:valine--tRNA ligase [Planctomycetota bacterium]
MKELEKFIEGLPKQYNSAGIEEKWYQHWDSEGLFHAEPNSGKKPYTIVIPPPNVTGLLHMGHALNNTLQDILIRFHRMAGNETLWMPGTDHAGIATQNVVEKQLAKEDLQREDLGREKFIERVWEWKQEYGGSIVTQLRRLGVSCDWERERFTMDEGLSRAVREVFVRLYNDGLIYRGRRLINWCPRCHSALADDEVEHQEVGGSLWHIAYPIKGTRQNLIVATTRPETLLGDTALAVHPEDKRYEKFVGQCVLLPVLGRKIPIITDEMVDMEFGTGVVKVTPAHDPNDYECGLRHELEQVVVIGPDGTMTEEAGKYAGLDRFRCRELLVEELEEKGQLEKTEEHLHAVGHCYRCDSIVEPYLSEQWFVRMKPLAKQAIEATRKGEVEFHPQRWEKVYLSWLENVRDWCISRQIWWGHQLPVWYCEDCGEITVSMADATKCSKCSSKNIQRDPDVLDTWFSSALWPFSTLGWPEETEELKYFYPTNVLVTDRGIIYFWVARMVMMGYYFCGEAPFSDVYIHGTVLDDEGRKMSKSLGNGIDPIDMIEQYGADAVRFTLAALTTEGQDIRLSPTRFEMGRNFINKLWNASRFVLMNLVATAPNPCAGDVEYEELEFEDRWILSRLAATSATARQALDNYRYSDLAMGLRDFAWHDICDWYLEITKARFRDGGESAAVAARVLAYVLDTMLRLLHPVIPYITEEIWGLLAKLAPQRGLKAQSEDAPPDLIRAPWPQAQEEWRDQKLEEEMNLAQEAIRAIRNVRSKFNLAARKPLAISVSARDEEVEQILKHQVGLIARLAVLEELEIAVALPKPAQAASEILDAMSIYVPLSGLMDVELEKNRLEKDLQKKEEFLRRSATKLKNEEFLSKAKPEIIERERALKEDLEAQIEKFQTLLESLES